MNQNLVIYSERQSDFFYDVTHNQLVDKMEETAEQSGLYVHDSEKASWKNNAPKIMELLKIADTNDVYVTFEYMIPYNMQRVDCMLYGTGDNGVQNVVHIELKQWSNESVKTSTSSGNFDEVDAFTGGAIRTIPHPSQQVRGYNNYMEAFMPVFEEEKIGLEGRAYCYNYLKETQKPTALYDKKYAGIQQQFRTYASDEKEKLANDLAALLKNGDGLSIFNKVQSYPMRPTRKLMESASAMLDEGNADAFSLIEEQIVAKNAILDKIRNLEKIDNNTSELFSSTI